MESRVKGITREAVYAAENALERKIGDIIKKFKVLAASDISAEGTEKYLLVKRGTDEMNKIIRFGDPNLERN